MSELVYYVNDMNADTVVVGQMQINFWKICFDLSSESQRGIILFRSGDSAFFWE